MSKYNNEGLIKKLHCESCIHYKNPKCLMFCDEQYNGVEFGCNISFMCHCTDNDTTPYCLDYKNTHQ